MQLPESFEELVTISEKHQLYAQLIKQLNKDLKLANVDLEFSEETLPTSLIYLLQETLFYLIDTKFVEYLNLLYVVDVSEDKIKALDAHDIPQMSAEVAFLILQREWQKVWYKNLYSKP